MTRLRARFPEESVEQIAVGGETDGDVVAACNALDLLGGPRLVLVRNAEELELERRQAIAGYLTDPAPGTCLAIFGGAGFEPGEPLVQAVEAVGDVRFFDAPDRKRAAEWVVKRFSELGVRCPQPIARRVVELAGEDMGDLALEVEKLATFGRDSAPDEEEVARLVPASVDVKPWEITDAWGRGDAPAMIALAVADIERPDEVSRVVAVLAGHVRKVCRAAAMVESGAGQDEVAKALRLKPYPARKLVDQAQRFGRGELGAAVIRLAEVDIAVKGGSRLDPRFELELALAEIAKAGERRDARRGGRDGGGGRLHRHLRPALPEQPAPGAAGRVDDRVRALHRRRGRALVRRRPWLDARRLPSLLPGRWHPGCPVSCRRRAAARPSRPPGDPDGGGHHALHHVRRGRGGAGRAG